MSVCALSIAPLLFASDALAFPLWPKGKNQEKKESEEQAEPEPEKAGGVEREGDKGAEKSHDQGVPGRNAGEPAREQGANPFPSVPTAPKNGAESAGDSTKSADDISKANDAATSAAIDAVINKMSSGNSTLPVEFVPGAGARDGVARDPMAIYRDCGVNLAEERKIRALAQEFESMQRVRTKMLMTLLSQLRQYELQTDPDPKAVMAKQDEINKVTDAMNTDRMKLLLSIRDVMTFDEKQRLVDTLLKDRR